MEEFGDAALVLKWIAWVGSAKSYRIFSSNHPMLSQLPRCIRLALNYCYRDMK